MRVICLAIICLITYATVQAQRISAPALIPAPVKMQLLPGAFLLDKKTFISAPETLSTAVALLKEYIGIEIQSSPTAKGIHLIIDSTTVKEAEGYRLSINPGKIEITAHDEAGILHAIQTVRQLNNKGQLQSCLITDYPRFAYRGMHLDVSRHFFPVSFVKHFIDILAQYKYNNFHWHLTDDQGWRIEIKKYPKLQSVAAWRDETLIGHKKELPHRFDGKKYGGYYTQEEIKDVIAYATARGINIIPEIEMPGHALAALAAYPSLGCTGGPYKTATFWGIFDDVFCAGKDSTFSFLEDVLDEVIALFPSPYIHIGGDECPKTRWNACPLCSLRMQQEKLPDADALQNYFIKRINQYVRSKGRKIIGWDEILEGGLAEDATVMSWRGTESGAAKQVIMTPEDELYFDHYQSLYTTEPLAAGGYTPLQEVYTYEPLKEVKGVQGQLWSEYLPTTTQAEYMLLPRAIALSEVAWSPQHAKDYPGFVRRLKKQSIQFKEDISYKNVVYKEKLLITLQGKAAIYYTTDGSPPGLYTRPIVIKKSSVIKTSDGFSQAFNIHKAVGAKVTLAQPQNTRYAGSLVNGIFGSDKYNDQQWLGFSGRDLDAIIDFGETNTIQLIGANILNYHWQRMWEPKALQFYASEDGVNYKLIAEENKFPVNGINNIRLKVPAVRARYLKVKGVNKGIIPPGEYGAGGNGLLMIDEIIVE
ncbi:family 20 glycosylhydrolase [Chitinophaga sp. SYP-B3965]|uniref:glycoside hydrolase family 20 protein n=1 Tax=Chitinophaga sp. SYP-B3965 TaxID=2663120 RepID=UPI00129A0318|nr:family 20 glycosylhydrolase [Chitinophaga sp. SYP-B3965]MRG48391.1 family 20 glycosylhydrolase [Chitinophaga sp. SYP-B3965]